MKIINQKTKKGFTLIELMVVIAIIGLLSAVAVPIILTVQRDSRDTMRLAQLDAIRIAATSVWTEQSAESQVYKDSSCQTEIPVISANTADSTAETTQYWICPGLGTASKSKQVTLTGNYSLYKATGRTQCTNGTDNSRGKLVVFAQNPGGAGVTGKFFLCTEGGSSRALEYKQQ